MQTKSTHKHIIACVSKSSGPRCEFVGRVSRRFTCPRAHTGSASHLHLYNIVVWHVQMGYCDHNARAHLLGDSVCIRRYSHRPLRFTDRLFA